MIRINNQYIDRFKHFKRSYNYMLAPGLWLSFDDETLEYLGIEMFYLADFKKVEPKAHNKINELLSKDILELV